MEFFFNFFPVCNSYAIIGNLYTLEIFIVNMKQIIYIKSILLFNFLGRYGDKGVIFHLRVYKITAYVAVAAE